MDATILLSKIPKGSKLVIYGAGETGRNIVSYINNRRDYNIIAWVDSKWKEEEVLNRKIESPYGIRKLNFDFIVIATFIHDWIREIQINLERMGIPKRKIVYFDVGSEKYRFNPEKLRCISLLDTGAATMNMGDCIIMEAVKSEMDYLLKNYFVTNFSTHTPIAVEEQISDNFRYNFLKYSKYTFLCGTDLLEESMDTRIPQWNMNLNNCSVLRNVILLGIGSSAQNKTGHFNPYTKELLTKVLSKDFIHSVRNEKARIMLKEIGLEAVNTGCPTVWGLNADFCQHIPNQKSNKVVFSISEFKKDVENDKRLVEFLKKNYQVVYFWPQAYMDYNYLRSIIDLEEIQVIKPNLESFKKVLQNEDVDYVGTRLHGGIFALQHGKRTIILGIDNRAADMYKEININYIQYGDFQLLDKKIYSDLKTEINIPIDQINFFKNQF